MNSSRQSYQPPLLSLFMGCPAKPLPEIEPIAGDGVVDCRDPTLRI